MYTITIIITYWNKYVDYRSQLYPLYQGDQILLIDFTQDSFNCYCCEIIGDDINKLWITIGIYC